MVWEINVYVHEDRSHLVRMELYSQREYIKFPVEWDLIQLSRGKIYWDTAFEIEFKKNTFWEKHGSSFMHDKMETWG